MSVCLDIRMSLCLQPIELPVFNPLALDLMLVINSPRQNVDAIVATIHKDQALSARVLKMANSPVYSGLKPSETIKESAVRLGMHQITNLVMAASQETLHTSNTPVINDIMKELWLHSHACALGCRTLAVASGRAEIADQAYMAGLLHDIGKLYILKAMENISKEEDYTAILERDTILNVFTGFHVEFGCRLMDHWNIPPIYRTITANHHLPPSGSSDDLQIIVQAVNIFSRKAGRSLHESATHDEERFRDFILPEGSALLRMVETAMCDASL